MPKPEVYFDQIDPDAEGNAMLWYRSREDAAKAKDPPHDDLQTWAGNRSGWRVSSPTRIASTPCHILPDGRLYGTGDDYAGVFVFDPRTDQTTILGPRPGWRPTRRSFAATSSIPAAIPAAISLSTIPRGLGR